jgi:drug/metabolite transporter (DMT)-like permease
MPGPNTIQVAERPHTYYWVGAFMVLVAAFCFACKGVLIKLAYENYPVDAIALLALRMFFSLPFYLVITWRLSTTIDKTKLSTREW